MYHFELKPSRNHFSRAASTFDKEVEKLFDVFSSPAATEYFAPPCEIVDEEKFFRISLDIPGLQKEDMVIEVKDNRLHVTGERKSPETPDRKEGIIRTERRYGKLSRVFSLPQNVNADLIEARFENGVLDLILPKEEKSHSRKIEINGWNTKTELKN